MNTSLHNISNSRNSRKLKIQLQKVMVIIACWLFIGFLIAIYDHLSFFTDFSNGPSESYSFYSSLSFNLLAALMGSAMGGTFLVFYVGEKLRNKPYGYTLFLVFIVFILIVIIITVVLGGIFIRKGTGFWPFADANATADYIAYLKNPMHSKNTLIWAGVVMLTQFALQVNDKFGQGLLWDFIRGKYQTPQEETRVFMMLDITSSTSIAEELGNKRYYQLLRDFFGDITNSIIFNGGKIYQYVGDEIVISWKYEDAVTDHQCISCYFDVREKIAGLSEKYQSRYGLVPDFKAALHYGKVTAGEIGIIKRDITYSGDVLNTVARILSKCNHYKEKILISGKLYKDIRTLESGYGFIKMGEDLLKGKSGSIDIYAVSIN